MYEVIKGYRDNAGLRKSFNELAENTFQLNFESWYQNGYWSQRYNPYSAIIGGRVAANVSVNRMDMLWNGKLMHFIQLGTVMTDKEYRKRGMIRRIMEEVEKDYGQNCDGMFLFANDSVLDFYPKFGFRKAAEYRYSKSVQNTEERTMVPFSIDSADARRKLESAIEKSTVQGSFGMTDNMPLLMFYVTYFMQNNVYYNQELDAYVIAEINHGDIFLHSVFSEQKVEPEWIIKAFGTGIEHVVLGFTPENRTGYVVEELHERNTTLFVKGVGLKGIDREKIMVPTLAHS